MTSKELLAKWRADLVEIIAAGLRERTLHVFRQLAAAERPLLAKDVDHLNKKDPEGAIRHLVGNIRTRLPLSPTRRLEEGISSCGIARPKESELQPADIN